VGQKLGWLDAAPAARQSATPLSWGRGEVGEEYASFVTSMKRMLTCSNKSTLGHMSIKSREGVSGPVPPAEKKHITCVAQSILSRIFYLSTKMSSDISETF